MLAVILLTCRSILFDSMGSGASLPLQPSERLHELSSHSKSFSSVDARHALKLCEMSYVLLRLRVA